MEGTTVRILFVGTEFTLRDGTAKLPPFQQVDLDLLRGLGHDVRSLAWRGRNLPKLLRASRSSDLVYCWHISYHAFAASLAARKLACVVGGYEFANVPEADYGNLRKRRMRLVTRRVWAVADALLFVDPSLADEASRAFGHPGRAFHVPTGYDSAFWTPADMPKENIAVTVAHASTPSRMRVKGVDLFFSAARACPDIEFHVVGETPPGLAASAPPNVRLHGWLDAERLRALYRRAKVYCQLSLHEGLPNAVCEAMLCGCVPVGTAANGIPTAIGDAGFIVARDLDAICDGIRSALASEHLRAKSRERIATLFSIERRAKGLRGVLEGLSGTS